MKITKHDEIYIENQHRIKKVHLDDQDYSKALTAMICVCADAIITDMSEQVFYLPRRVVKPMKGYWSIGGRRLPGESASKAIARNFERETTVKLASRRFHPISVIEVIWKDRKEAPTSVGKHDLIHIYTIELSKKEMAQVSANLCKAEYKMGSLESFDRMKMVAKKIHPALIDIYDKIFPQRR